MLIFDYKNQSALTTMSGKPLMILNRDKSLSSSSKKYLH